MTTLDTMNSKLTGLESKLELLSGSTSDSSPITLPSAVYAISGMNNLSTYTLKNAERTLIAEITTNTITEDMLGVGILIGCYRIASFGSDIGVGAPFTKDLDYCSIVVDRIGFSNQNLGSVFSTYFTAYRTKPTYVDFVIPLRIHDQMIGNKLKLQVSIAPTGLSGAISCYQINRSIRLALIKVGQYINT